jgi:hypothetical protein
MTELKNLKLLNPPPSDFDLNAAPPALEALVWCRNDQVLATYQSAVARQGRTLVEGEYLAMKAWIQSAGRGRCKPLARPSASRRARR